MKKKLLILTAALLMLSVSVSAFEPVAADLTESFVLERAETSPVLDGVVNDTEYTLISAYSPDNEDWFISDYGPVRQYAGEGLPDYSMEVYGAWDDTGVYIAVLSDCDDHKVSADPAWNGCGVMIGFVADSPDSGLYDSYTDYAAMNDVLQEIAFNYSSDGTLTLNNTTNDAVHGENVNTVYAHTDGWDIYEMYFSWDFIGCEPELDNAIGMGMMLSRNNAEAADGIDWVCFQTDVVNAKLPQTYTKLVLKDDIVPVEAAETTAAAETVSAAPQTFDACVLAAAAAVVAGAGYVVAKKR